MELTYENSLKILDTITSIDSKAVLGTKQITDKIQIIEPIKVIDLTERGFDFGLWISVLIAIISTSILIWNEIKKSKVYGKVISKIYSPNASFSFTNNNNENITINGQRYVLKLSLICLRKTLNYKDVNVFLTYGNEIVKGEIFWTKYEDLTIENYDGTISEKKLKLPANDFLTFNNVLVQEKTSFFYLKFIVPNKNGSILYDKLELEFVKTNGKKMKVEVFEINSKQFYVDESLMENYDPR